MLIMVQKDTHRYKKGIAERQGEEGIDYKEEGRRWSERESRDAPIAAKKGCRSLKMNRDALNARRRHALIT